ncbi:hypothetical protein AJ78_06975 [Emergomyces pasteurianus Ep9510]|uniref:Uncharacterized protein n=1 Tax=Emergomyces pasteurianus Ep9510 TaxID=1447872 RepID=A0A1J9P7K2_9EURO|nr:hypothetical protein AJ78_06975 [Emergomyces pasteurianus Ep9510]
MTKSKHDKKLLKKTVKDMIAGDDNIELALKKTTEEEDFKYEKSLNVYKIVVDKSSGRGYTQITKEDKDSYIIYTGHGESDCVKAEILARQTCMLYRRSTVLYILSCST